MSSRDFLMNNYSKHTKVLDIDYYEWDRNCYGNLVMLMAGY